MKTIRRGVFETNSSSTHTITISSAKKIKENNILPLCEDNILYPERLDDYTREITDEVYELRCIGPDMKAAFVATIIYSEYYNNNIKEKIYNNLLNYLCNSLEYSSIQMTKNVQTYWDDYEDYHIQNIETLETYINYIKDSEIYINYLTTPY